MTDLPQIVIHGKTPEQAALLRAYYESIPIEVRQKMAREASEYAGKIIWDHLVEGKPLAPPLPPGND
jgi:hypothetical protein